MPALVMVGTRKGAFLLQSDDRRRWQARGPMLQGWAVLHMAYDGRDGTLYAAGASNHFGPAVAISRDLGETWSYSSKGLAYADGGKVIKVWHVEPGRRSGHVYIGVEEAGLFESHDGGESFAEVAGLRRTPTRHLWEPGNGGLCLHSICLDPANPNRMWIGISAAGTYRTDDGGETWRPFNKDVQADFLPAGQEVGHCVHKLLYQPGGVLFQQNHQGVYRSLDLGENWERLDGNGLPSPFGFPAAVHPRDSQTYYVVPLIGDFNRVTPGEMAVWRTRDGGRSWHRLSRGIPAPAHLNVLREGMSGDGGDPLGVYVGTTTGQVFASADEGESWSLAADLLPPILSVSAALLP